MRRQITLPVVTFTRCGGRVTVLPTTNDSNKPFGRVTVLPTTNESKKHFEIKRMGIMTDINFYIPDAEGDTTGMAFRTAYKAAKDTKDYKELCAYVGSMLCSVVPGFRNSVVESLNEIGVKPCFMSLPSQSLQNNVVDSELPQLDWTSILVIFGYCCLLLLNLDNRHSTDYVTYMSNRIRDLQAEVRWDPNNKLDIPFDASKAKPIKTMLGSRDLCETVFTFLADNTNHPDLQVSKVCNYLKTIFNNAGFW